MTPQENNLLAMMKSLLDELIDGCTIDEWIEQYEEIHDLYSEVTA